MIDVEQLGFHQRIISVAEFKKGTKKSPELPEVEAHFTKIEAALGIKSLLRRARDGGWPAEVIEDLEQSYAQAGQEAQTPWVFRQRVPAVVVAPVVEPESQSGPQKRIGKEWENRFAMEFEPVALLGLQRYMGNSEIILQAKKLIRCRYVEATPVKLRFNEAGLVYDPNSRPRDIQDLDPIREVVGYFAPIDYAAAARPSLTSHGATQRRKLAQALYGFDEF